MADLVARLLLVDDVEAALAPHDEAVALARLRRLDRCLIFIALPNNFLVPGGPAPWRTRTIRSASAAVNPAAARPRRALPYGARARPRRGRRWTTTARFGPSRSLPAHTPQPRRPGLAVAGAPTQFTSSRGESTPGIPGSDAMDVYDISRALVPLPGQAAYVKRPVLAESAAHARARAVHGPGDRRLLRRIDPATPGTRRRC